jgi:hypothetical protein
MDSIYDEDIDTNQVICDCHPGCGLPVSLRTRRRHRSQIARESHQSQLPIIEEQIGGFEGVLGTQDVDMETMVDGTSFT